jgi:hypothetical protein
MTNVGDELQVTVWRGVCYAPILRLIPPNPSDKGYIELGWLGTNEFCALSPADHSQP